VGYALLLLTAALCPAADPARPDRGAVVHPPPVRPILEAAADLALQQCDAERFWTDRVIRRVGELQVRAGDFDGALRSLRRVRDTFSRDCGLLLLTEALARAGRRDRAADVARLLDPGWGWTPERRADAVQLPWAESRIAIRDLRSAAEAVEHVKDPLRRREGLQRLAVAYAQAGNSARATDYFARAADTAACLAGEGDRAAGLSGVAEAQRSAGSPAGAAETVRRLAAAAERFKDPWISVLGLRQAAALTARLGDRATARDLFERAVARSRALTRSNRLSAIGHVAAAQAEAGLIDDAARTAAAIEPNNSEDTIAAAEAAIALARLQAGDPDGAARRARSITRFTWYRDDVLDAVVGHHLRRGETAAALATAEGIVQPSRRAAADLRVAAALARAGRRGAAAEVADRVRLASEPELPPPLDDTRTFHFWRPESWGFLYDAGPGFTMASHAAAVEQAAGVAGAAMGLDQALGGRTARSYAEAFNDINISEVVEALARAQVAAGDPRGALGRALLVGGEDRVSAANGDAVRRSVERRIHALVGVAEGVLDGGANGPPAGGR
jgi:hypothetical protein